MTDPCLEPDPSIPKQLFYSGRCEDVYADAVCGEEAVGERLYLGEDGLGYCDCDEGWLRYRGSWAHQRHQRYEWCKQYSASVTTHLCFDLCMKSIISMDRSDCRAVLFITDRAGPGQQ